MDLADKVEAHERTLRGSNGDVGIVGQQRLLEKEQVRQAEELARHDEILCHPEKGVVVQMVHVEEFVKTAKEFMDDFHHMTNKLILGVLGTVLGGIALQLILNYIVTKGNTP